MEAHLALLELERLFEKLNIEDKATGPDAIMEDFNDPELEVKFNINVVHGKFVVRMEAHLSTTQVLRPPNRQQLRNANGHVYI